MLNFEIIDRLDTEYFSSYCDGCCVESKPSVPVALVRHRGYIGLTKNLSRDCVQLLSRERKTICRNRHGLAPSNSGGFLPPNFRQHKLSLRVRKGSGENSRMDWTDSTGRILQRPPTVSSVVTSTEWTKGRGLNKEMERAREKNGEEGNQRTKISLRSLIVTLH